MITGVQPASAASDYPLERTGDVSTSLVLSARTLAPRDSGGSGSNGTVWSARQSGLAQTWEVYPEDADSSFSQTATNTYSAGWYSFRPADQYGVAALYSFYASMLGSSYSPTLSVFA